MAKDPRFNFYPDNWEGGTEGFTLEQEGAYLALIILQSRRGAFTAEQARDKLMTKTRGDAAACAALWSFLMPKFRTDGGSPPRYWSERLEKEIAKSAATSKKQSEKASKRWHGDPAHAAAYTPAMPPGTGIGNGSTEGEGAGEETARGLTDRLEAALNPIYLEPIEMNAPRVYPGLNFAQELAHFRSKVMAAPGHYNEHTVDGLRLAFLRQLKQHNPNKSTPHGNPNKSTQHVESLVQDFNQRHAGDPAT